MSIGKNPDTTLTGTLTDPQGNAVNGTLTFTLQGFGATVPLIAGSQALPGLTFTTPVAAGVFSVSFYSNQIITAPGPLVTFYNISFAPSTTTTTVFAFSENFQFSAGTFDISQLTPLGAVVPGKSSPTFVAPNVFTAQAGQFLTGLTSSGNFTTGPTTLTLMQANGVRGWSSGNTSPLANADTGLSRIAAGTVTVGNGTQGDATGTVKANQVIGLSVNTGALSAIVAQNITAPAIGWNATTGGADQKAWDFLGTSSQFIGRAVNDADSAATPWMTINRGSGFTIGTIVFGGTSVQLPALNLQGLVTTYNGVATAGFGVSTVVAITSQKNETAAADANVLTFTPPAVVGTYRVSVAISVSAATSGVIGWTLTWTDSSGNSQAPGQAQALFQQGTPGPQLTYTVSAAGNYQGSSIIDVNNAAANIVVKWVGGGTTTAKMSATIERII